MLKAGGERVDPSPGAATGVCPGAQPLAVGIFRVGMPCGLAAGITGALPTACSSRRPCRRTTIATAPISATIRPTMPDKLIELFPVVARRLAEAARKSGDAAGGASHLGGGGHRFQA